MAADIAAGCTKPGSVVTAAAAAEPDADLTANAATEQDADLAANAAAEHLCRQALRLVLRLSLSGRFLLRFGVTPAAATAVTPTVALTPEVTFFVKTPKAEGT